MRSRKIIALLVLLVLLPWTMGAQCAPMTTTHGPDCAMHPAPEADHHCCPPQMPMDCDHIMAGGMCPQMLRCLASGSEEVASAPTKSKHDSLRAQALAQTRLLPPRRAHAELVPERGLLRHPRPVFEAKTDLRI